MSVVKFLPPALQDDYYELITYVKEKIIQSRPIQEISFIEAEPGHLRELGDEEF